VWSFFGCKNATRYPGKGRRLFWREWEKVETVFAVGLPARVLSLSLFVEGLKWKWKWRGRGKYSPFHE